MSTLEGRIALVTGGGAGIGRAAALELGRRGARVAIHYRRSRAGAEETASVIGPSARVFGGDLTRAADVTRVVDDVQREMGPIDILVNNAGDLIERRSLLEMTESLWREVQDANVLTTVLCTQAVARSMVERRRGVIVNMSSLAAHNGGGPGAMAYAAAKAAIIAFTKAAAKELAPHGIRVNCVSPGLIDNTQFHGRFTPREAFDATAKTIPLGRAGQPEDVAAVIAFLCSDDAAFLAGETIEVNGGMFMR